MKCNKKTLWKDIVPTFAAAVLIIVFAIGEKQSFIKTLPTLITLAVQILLVRANRLAFLIGGANSILYGINYLCESLYFSAFVAIAISPPIQFFSYFNWKRKAVDGHTDIRTLDHPSRLIVTSALLLSWWLCYTNLGSLISSGRFTAADSLVFVIGIAVPLLSAFRFVDARYLNIVSVSISLAMWILITIEEPQNINFVIISVYNLFRVTESAVSWTRISRKLVTSSAAYPKNKLSKAKRRTQ